MSSFIRFERRANKLVPIRYTKEWTWSGDLREFRTVRITELRWPNYGYTLEGDDEMWPPYYSPATWTAGNGISCWQNYPLAAGQPYLPCDCAIIAPRTKTNVAEYTPTWELPYDYLDFWRWQGTPEEWEQQCLRRESQDT